MYVNLSLGRFWSTSGLAIGSIIGEIENVTGSRWNDVLVGNARANRLHGYDGGDTIAGAGGDDVLIGGLGGDLVNGGDGVDTCDAEDERNCEP
jgi:Ca2+-binding RTX toxin-like protein